MANNDEQFVEIRRAERRLDGARVGVDGARVGGEGARGGCAGPL